MAGDFVVLVYRESVKVANLDAYNAIEREAVHTCVRVKCPNIYFAAVCREQDTHWTWFFSSFDSREDVDGLRSSGRFGVSTRLGNDSRDILRNLASPQPAKNRANQPSRFRG